MRSVKGRMETDFERAAAAGAHARPRRTSQDVWRHVGAGSSTTRLSVRDRTKLPYGGGSCLRRRRTCCPRRGYQPFCLVRPPGHHALPEHVMGFCLFNNIALAARVATRELAWTACWSSIGTCITATGRKPRFGRTSASASYRFTAFRSIPAAETPTRRVRAGTGDDPESARSPGALRGMITCRNSSRNWPIAARKSAATHPALRRLRCPSRRSDRLAGTGNQDFRQLTQIARGRRRARRRPRGQRAGRRLRSGRADRLRRCALGRAVRLNVPTTRANDENPFPTKLIWSAENTSDSPERITATCCSFAAMQWFYPLTYRPWLRRGPAGSQSQRATSPTRSAHRATAGGHPVPTISAVSPPAARPEPSPHGA